MENATKALLIAAGVLIGIMVISLGISLYASLGSYVDSTKEQLEENEIAKFNAQFFKYDNIDVGIQDVVTVANIAYENNKNLGDINGEADENSLYVSVNIQYNGTQQLEDIQKTINSQESNVWNSSKLLSEDSRESTNYYTAEIMISNVTGRVYEINFKYNT